MVYRFGKNHKDEKILILYSKDCPICGEYMHYFEFLFNITQIDMKSETDKLVRLQQIESLIESVTKGEKVSVSGVLFGCPYHYGQNKKEVVDKLQTRPYITLDAEDIFQLNNMPISHVYLGQPIK